MKKITQKLTKSIWQSGLLAIAFLFSLTINAQEVGQEYIGNPTINTAGNNGKAIHVLATADIADLSVYSLDVISNGGGSINPSEYVLSGSANAGDFIM